MLHYEGNELKGCKPVQLAVMHFLDLQCLSDDSCVSVTGGQQNDLTSRHKALYLWLLTKRSYNYRQSLRVPVKARATGTNASFLDRPYKNQTAMDTYTYQPVVS